MATLTVADQGRAVTISFEDIVAYHGRSSIAGAAHAFKAMERAFPLLSPDGPPERHLIVVHSGFGGDGARDAFEVVTGAVSGGRYQVSPELAGPEVPEAPGGRFFFRLGHGGTTVDLALRPGLVPERFVDLACREAPGQDEAEETRRMKEEMAARLLSLAADQVYDAEMRG